MSARQQGEGGVHLEAYPDSDGSDPKFNTADADVARIWDTLQRYQVDFAIEQERTAYETSLAWQRARTVLDVGTGNGYYLRRIASLFPGKAYRGIYTSQELIAIADPTDGVEFRCHEVAEETRGYDFAIMRLLLQHLTDPEAMLASVARVTAPGGAAFVIDCCDALRRFEPDLPEFRRFFGAYAEQQASIGRRRDIADRLPDVVRHGREWRVGDHLRLVLSSTRPGNLGYFRRIYGL